MTLCWFIEFLFFSTKFLINHKFCRLNHHECQHRMTLASNFRLQTTSRNDIYTQIFRSIGFRSIKSNIQKYHQIFRSIKLIVMQICIDCITSPHWAAAPGRDLSEPPSLVAENGLNMWRNDGFLNQGIPILSLGYQGSGYTLGNL